MSKLGKSLLLITLVVLIIFVLGILAGILLSQKKFSFLAGKKAGETVETPLPTPANFGAWLQSEFADLDNDGAAEAIALYHDQGDATKLYKVFFVIYKLTGRQWTKLVEQELEGFSINDETYSPQDIGKNMNNFVFADLTDDQINDILVSTRAEGSGSFFGIFVFGFVGDKLTKLWAYGPIPKGEAGIEKGKIWTLEPIYGPDDPNCCPSNWQKNWWQWNGNEFEKAAEVKEQDWETIKSIPFSSAVTKPSEKASKDILAS